MITARKTRAIIDALVRLRILATDEQALEVPVLYPVWKEECEYNIGDRVVYNDVLYKVITAHISQTDWTPEKAPSLFAEILIPDENILVSWKQPESTNPYAIGAKVNHNNKTWISIIDNNIWEPGIYGWEEIEE